MSVFDLQARGEARTRHVRRCTVVVRETPKVLCGRECPSGEDTCFDHIPPEVLEEANADVDEEMSEAVSAGHALRKHPFDDLPPIQRPEGRTEPVTAITAPAREEREEERQAVALKAHEMKFVCGEEDPPGCGRKITGAAPYAMHRRKCADALGQKRESPRHSAPAAAAKPANKVAPARRPHRADPPPSEEGEPQEVRRAA